MPKSSAERTRSRREEIISACAGLYAVKSFKEITLKEIGNATSFTRTSIYNYFQTKEEIFLALLQREYRLWIDSLQRLRQEHAALDRTAFAAAIAHSLEERTNLLKLLSMNHYDLEENCRLEQLAAFKVVYGQSMTEMQACLRQFFPAMPEPEQTAFLYGFFPFLFGVYPYSHVTEKQKKAMQLAGVPYVFHTVYEMIFAEVQSLLHDREPAPQNGLSG